MTKQKSPGLGRAAVVGAGRMGHGIGLELARGGFRVGVYDSVPGRAEAAIDEARRDAGDLIAAGVLTDAEVETVVGRLEPCDNLEDAAHGARFVAEAIVEELEVKRRIFAELDRVCPPPTILASNTSSISISAIAAACQHPQRVVLVHWILPPHLIPVVEVAPGDATDSATVEATRQMLEAIGKWPIYVRKDIPGYLLNRLQFAILREAMHLVGEGIATPEEIDRLVRGSLARRWPVTGLFRQADMAGLDVYRQIFRYLAADLDASADPPPVLADLVARGLTGAQAGAGFYTWQPDEPDAYLARRNAELVRLLRDDRSSGV